MVGINQGQQQLLNGDDTVSSIATTVSMIKNKGNISIHNSLITNNISIKYSLIRTITTITPY
jgi:hypothetical protein